MIFLETSVLVAAWQDNHIEHRESFLLLEGLSPKTGCTSIHCVTELFSVMTRLPPRLRVSPVEAWQLVQQTQSLLSIISLSTEEITETIRAFVERGLSGGMVYDAVVMSSARKIQAKAVYTWNKKHFDQVAPDWAERIVQP